MNEVEKIKNKYIKIGKKKELANLKVSETKPPLVVFEEILNTNDELKGIKESLDEIKNKPEKEEVVNVYYEEIGKVIESLENLKDVISNKNLSVNVPLDNLSESILNVERAIKGIPQAIIPNEVFINRDQLELLKKENVIIPPFPLEEIKKVILELGTKLENKDIDFPKIPKFSEQLDEIIVSIKNIKMGNVSYSGYKDINLLNTSNQQISPATEGTLLNILGYNFHDYDDTTTTNVIYIGNVSLTGTWEIQRFNSSTKLMEYSRGSTGYSTNWGNRVTLTYA